MSSTTISEPTISSSAQAPRSHPNAQKPGERERETVKVASGAKAERSCGDGSTKSVILDSSRSSPSATGLPVNDNLYLIMSSPLPNTSAPQLQPPPCLNDTGFINGHVICPADSMDGFVVRRSFKEELLPFLPFKDLFGQISTSYSLNYCQF